MRKRSINKKCENPASFVNQEVKTFASSCRLAPLLVQRVRRYLPLDLILYLPTANIKLNPQYYPPPTTIGERIRHYRLKNGLSQQEVAEEVGIARSWLGRLENNAIAFIEPRLVQKIAKIFGVNPSEFLPHIEDNEIGKDFIDYLIPVDSLGSRIRNLRYKAGLAQKDLAKRLKVSKACVCRYEKNISRPNEKMLKKIAKVLRVNIKKLKGGW